MSATRTKPFGVPTAKQSSAGNLSQHAGPAAASAPTPLDGTRQASMPDPTCARSCGSCHVCRRAKDGPVYWLGKAAGPAQTKATRLQPKTKHRNMKESK